MPRTKSPTILALDPGLRTLGYAVLSGRRLLTSGVLSLEQVPSHRRLARVREALAALIRGHEPEELVMEDVPRRPLDIRAGLPALGRLLRRIGTNRSLSVHSYSTRAIRQSVVGNGWAKKRDVARTICRRFRETRVCLTQDRKWKERHWQNMFDAIAAGLHHQTVTKPPSRSR